MRWPFNYAIFLWQTERGISIKQYWARVYLVLALLRSLVHSFRHNSLQMSFDIYVRTLNGHRTNMNAHKLCNAIIHVFIKLSSYA